MASALSLGVSATVTSGTSFGKYSLLTCKGYKFANDPNADPWLLTNCPTQLKNQTGTANLGFGTLITQLKDQNGTVTGGADCFYGEDFFIVYLYPDAWGGKGYQISQAGATLPLAIQDTVVFTPVYSSQDKFCWGPDPNNPCVPGYMDYQGELNQGTEAADNPDINKDKLARTGGLILKSKRGRIVRAQYGIPPKPGAGQTRPTGWAPIPISTTAGTYSASLTISLVEWQ